MFLTNDFFAIYFMHVPAYISNPHNINKAWKGQQYHNSFFSTFLANDPEILVH